MKHPSHISAFDLDHTLLNVNSAFHFALFLFRQGTIGFGALVYIVYCYLRHRFLGLSIAELHSKVFRRLFWGKPLDVFALQMERYMQTSLASLYYMPALERLRAAQEAGHYTLIISSSVDFVVRPFAEDIGVDAFHSTRYALDAEGRMDCLLHLVLGQDKAAILAEVAAKFGVPRENITAYSDSYHDLAFLEYAGHAVAVRPDRKLAAEAAKRGWEVI